jgi:type VI secretion system protein
MAHERLLERIRNQERRPEARASATLAQEIQSIAEHLQRLLNTRQGSVPILPDYGIPDFTDLPGDTFTETAAEMRERIRQVLARYEPRLAEVAVRLEPAGQQPSEVAFRIEAVLARDRKVPLVLETSLTTEGRARVSA